MNAKDCQEYYHQVISTTQTDGTGLSYTPAVMSYAASFEPVPGTDWTITTSNNLINEDTTDDDDEYFEMISEKEIRQVLSEIFLWTSGMGPYPELLAQICPVEICGDTQSEDPEERSMVGEKMIAQVLRWVLGEI